MLANLLSVQKEMNNVCRICLQEVKLNNGTNLYTKVNETKNILKMIELCFQIILKCKGFLPSIICNYCMNELNIAYSFRKKCITSEEKILSHYRQYTNNYINEAENDVKVSIESHEQSAYIDIKNIPIVNCSSNKVENDVKDIQENIEKIFSEGKQNDHSDENDDSDINTPELSNQKSSFTTRIKRKRSFWRCTYCDEKFETRKLLLQHRVSTHARHQHNIGIKTGYGATRRYNCKKCSYSSPYSQSLITHVRRKHTGEKPYVCGECGKRFSDFSCLYSHRRTHSNTTHFVCSKCGKQFKTGSGLRQHSRFHEGGKYCCEICKKVYKSKHTLRDHILQHNNIRNFSCEDCGSTFVTSSGLIHHRQIHIKKKEERNFECDLCEFKTHKRKKLTIHVQSHIEEIEDKPHKCKLCVKTFYTRQGVQSHQRVHAAEKEFRCPSCPKAYTRRRSLLRHSKDKHATEYHQSNHQILVKKCPNIKDNMNDENKTD